MKIIPANYQEITLPTAGPATGNFALIVYPVGAGGGAINVNITPPSGLNATTLTTTPLLANQTYTSTPIFDFDNSVLGFLNAMAFSDQPSATNGFMIQQSADGVNWDLNSAVASVLANTGLGIKTAITARYARISYTNGANAQGIFRLVARAAMA